MTETTQIGIAPPETQKDSRIWMYAYDSVDKLTIYACSPPNNDFDFLIHGDYKIKDGMIRVHGDQYLKSYLPHKSQDNLVRPDSLPYTPELVANYAVAPENIYMRPAKYWFWGRLKIREASQRVNNVRYAVHGGVFRVFYSSLIVLVNDKLPAREQ